MCKIPAPAHAKDCATGWPLALQMHFTICIGADIGSSHTKKSSPGRKTSVGSESGLIHTEELSELYGHFLEQNPKAEHLSLQVC